MKTVKSLADLHKAGAKVEGLRFIEIKGKDHSTADLTTVLSAIDKNSNTLEAALYASVKAIVEGLGGQEITVQMPEHRPVTRWVFTIKRDREGYLEKIEAAADMGH